MRVGAMGQPFALDFGTVMQFGAAIGADAALLADVLPAAEAEIIAEYAGEDAGDIGEDEPPTD